MANDLLVSDVIESTCRSEDTGEGTFSGWYCRRCAAPLMTGATVCPGCQWQFQYPTMSFEMLGTIHLTWKDTMARERRTEEEVERAAEIARRLA